jgi:hypothetical protein
MDEHRHKILIILVFFMIIYPKRKKLVPSFTTKHIRSLTKGEENEEKGEKNEEN